MSAGPRDVVPTAPDRRLRGLLLGLWLVSLLAGVACLGFFAAGLLRDSHFGEVAVPLELGEAGPWRTEAFRLWGGDPYVLWLTTLGPQPPFREDEATGRGEAERGTAREPTERPRYAGRIEVRLLSPDGASRIDRRYGGDRLEHVAGEGMAWTRLDRLRLEGSPLRAWRLEARVLEGDPRFGGEEAFRTRLLLRKDRPDVGMGGLLNYVAIVPAGLFLLASLGLALALARRGGPRAPLWISGLFVAAAVIPFLVSSSP